MDELQSVKASSGEYIVNEIADGIRNDIQKRIYQSGDKIKEIELCSRFGVSRTPVREAFRLLQQEGLLIHIPHCGVQVAEIGEKEMFDVLSIRARLEAYSSGLAALQSTPEDIASLREMNEKLCLNGAKSSILDEEFHLYIAKMGKNHILVEILSSLYVKNRIRDYLFPIRQERLPYTCKEHEDIIAALEKKDGVLAEKYTEIHFYCSILSNKEKLRQIKEMGEP